MSATAEDNYLDIVLFGKLVFVSCKILNMLYVYYCMNLIIEVDESKVA